MECLQDTTTSTAGAEQDQLRAFLSRLGWYKKHDEESSRVLPPPTLDTLRRLHELHLRGTPFENLDLHCGRHITLELPTLYDKIVNRHRGGFCYELNGLYAHMLKLLGFETTLYSARVFVEGQWRLVHSHCLVVVKVAADDGSGRSEMWVSDVGFAASPQVPLRWDLDAGQEQEGDAEWAGFRFTKMMTSEVEADAGASCVLFERRSLMDGLWYKTLLIYPEPRELHELIPPCDALQADREAHFNKRVFVSAVSETQRKTLSGLRRLITTTFADGVRQEQPISLDVDPPGDAQKEKEAYVELLKREFGLELTPDEQAALDLGPSARNTHLF